MHQDLTMVAPAEPSLELGQRWKTPDGVEVVIADDFERDGFTRFIGTFTNHPRRTGRRGVTTARELVARGFALAPARR